MALKGSFRYLNQYDLHKKIVNEYFLQRPGDSKHFERDKTKDKTDFDVIQENHKFLWEDNEEPLSWEQEFAKRYYDRLFKEYCISDLSLYKENKIAMRWRIEKEVINGKGQFICGNKVCPEESKLRTWEVNFGYNEEGMKKNALVKLRLCPDCSLKLNYHSKKREVKRLNRRKSDHERDSKHKQKKENKDVQSNSMPSTSSSDFEERSSDHKVGEELMNSEENPWENIKPIENKSRDDEMEEYLDELLL